MSYGQQLTKEFLEELTGLKAIENARPDSLEGLEVDLLFPKIRLAVEFQGDQHYLPIYGFKDHNRQKENDIRKRRMVFEQGYVLLRLKAIDLNFFVLEKKLRSAGKSLKIPMRARNPDKANLARLNKLAVDYRKKLIANYDSPTCRRPMLMKKKIKEWRLSN